MWAFWLFGLWISKSGKFLLKLRTDHSGKFAPREINPLYGVMVDDGNIQADVYTYASNATEHHVCYFTLKTHKFNQTTAQ